MSHITQEQRYTISQMLNQGYSKTSISKVLCKDKSVIGREIKRNSDLRSGEYRCDLAQRKYHQRQSYKSVPRTFSKDMQLYVESLIQQDYSPEQIVGISKKEHKACVSHERIYQHIWKDKKQKGELHLHLRHKGRQYRKRGSAKDLRGIIKDRVGIENRPKIVDKRSRFGDIEADLIIGKNHKQAILTLNDRASGVLKMKKIKSKESKVVARAINQLLDGWIPYIHTITSDNGKEFAEHKLVSEELGIDFYFAQPYHSWERGSNENLNGLIRQYFPKKYDFNLIDEQKVREIEKKINSRPRKRFNFDNPLSVMDKLLFNQKVAFST
jgi:IS30 family transposase